MDYEINDRFTRARWIFGEKFEILQNARVLVCGCGGVGGALIEALYRSGVVNLSVIDCDEFDITNPIKDIIKDNVIVLNEPGLRDFLQRHYYDSITIDTLESIGDMTFFKYRLVNANISQTESK